MAAAQRWFAEQLNGIEGGEARDYLARRGIDAKAIERFGIGLAPDSARRSRRRSRRSARTSSSKPAC